MATGTSMQRGRTWPYLLLVLLLGFAGYTALARWWSYSDGERVGVLQKLSRKGWVCKTYEGELAQYVVTGVTPQIWAFTVSDPAVAQKLNALLGERVRLHYGEHVGLPTSCFGDTRYFVDRVEEVDPPKPAPVTPGPAPAETPLPST
jgi:hypothetical protein